MTLTFEFSNLKVLGLLSLYATFPTAVSMRMYGHPFLVMSDFLPELY